MKKQFVPWFKTISKCAVAPIGENLLPEEAVFGFTFPNTFSAKESWLAERKNSAAAYFFEDNVAKVVIKNENKETTWLMAYNHIARSTFGSTVIPKPVSVDAILYPEEEIKVRVEKWIAALNLLPFVSAGKADQGDPTELIEISIPDSWKNINEIIYDTDSGNSLAYLKDNGQVSWVHPTSADVPILNKYILNKKYTSWPEFYDALRHYLAELINSAPEVPSVTEPITDEAKLQKIMKMKNERGVTLQQWLDAFNKIPGVKAELHTSEYDVNRIVEITICTSTKFLSDPDDTEDYQCFYLLSDGTAEESDALYGGERCSLYENWVLDERNMTWQYFYDKTLELSEKYLESVPMAPVP